VLNKILKKKSYMVKAADVKIKAEQRIQVIAKEFIWKTVRPQIIEAAEQGLFEIRIPIPGEISYDLAVEVSLILNKSWDYQVTTDGVTAEGYAILNISWRAGKNSYEL
jgi:hypothetical protein